MKTGETENGVTEGTQVPGMQTRMVSEAGAASKGMPKVQAKKLGRKPRLTDHVLSGILDGLLIHEAGEVDDMMGDHSPESVRAYNRTMDALAWTSAMIRYRAERRKK